MESLNSSVGSNGLQLIRVITLSVEIPRGEEVLVGTTISIFDRWAISRAR
jgi:hypothetical protein